jgi:outer membrane receptor for Fe3+-dicitrate
VVNFKRRLLAFRSSGVTSALAGLAIASSAQVAAQEAKPVEEMEEVVVSGIRASLRNALEVKRESMQVVDAISAEDIGDFPDKNIGEALQRVPGVQISRHSSGSSSTVCQRCR